MDYGEARALFAKARNPANGRKLAGNTYLVLAGQSPEGPVYAVRLHSTHILTFHADGAVTFDTGGWRTVTTRERMNRFAPHGISIGQRGGIWFVHAPAGELHYRDGLTVRNDHVAGAGTDADLRAERKLRRDAAAYAKLYMDALRAGNMKLPGPGDCWYCNMRDKATDRPLGEVTGNREHIAEHVRELYLVPSLIHNALAAFNASPAARSAIARRQMAAEHGTPPGDAGFVLDIAGRILRRYIYRQLGLAT